MQEPGVWTPDSKRWEAFFDLAKKRDRLVELDSKAGEANFWDDAAAAQILLKERSALRAASDRSDTIQKLLDDASALLELYGESPEDSLLDECDATLNTAETQLREFELTRMLSGPHDANNAIMEINAGAGGTEAQDWAEMLLRMYLRWAEQHKFKTEIMSLNEGDGAGIKSATLLIEGPNVFGFMRSERGVHRLVRISPFDSNARRHTSFASVSGVPDIEEDVKIEIRDEDLRIDTYRSSGAGGQHVNKTDSAVRLTHLPTGLVVACQSERSQHKNKARAMKLLKAKLFDLETQKQNEAIEKLAGERRKIDFGSQIRSYVMQPYQLVKDLRTGAETGNIQAVMDGDIDQFIEAYLLSEEFNRSE